MLLLQVVVAICFLVIIISLFNEATDFLTFSIAAMVIAAVATVLLLPDEVKIEDFILSIEWEVIVFLISIFTIIEVLDEKRIFEEIALRITEKFQTNSREFFWIICLISTLIAALIEDISITVIFVPMVIRTCQKMHINPAPFLLGMAVCINLASTLTPFGSSENILIANDFNLSALWFVSNLGLYFLITTLLTLILLDQLILKRSLHEIWLPHCNLYEEPCDYNHLSPHELVIIEEHVKPPVFRRNILALFIFTMLLFFIPNILLVGLIGLLMFVCINPRKNQKGRPRPDISYYLSKADFRLVFFFINLFILAYCMELNGTLNLIENWVISVAPSDIFLLSLFILIITSLFSGFLDNVPVTIMFIPLIDLLINLGNAASPLLIAFILGVNLGGNFLPQGTASDMITLEFAKKEFIHEMNYKRLLKVGGIFAVFHILMGILYLAFYIYVF